MSRYGFPVRIIGVVMATSAEAVTNFFEAVRANDVNKTVELLRAKSVDVNSKNPDDRDRTALHIAASKGYYDLARLLVDDYSAEVNAKDDQGIIPLRLASDAYEIKIVKFLLERNSKEREYAERFLNEKIVDELFEAAAANDIPKVVELIEEKKVDVDSVDCGNNNQTVLHVAATKGYEELVRVLVDKLGADIQVDDDYGDTPKNNAVDNRHHEIAKFFIERGYKEDPYADASDDSV